MIIGDPKHIERLASFGIDLTNEEALDTSFAALSAVITKEALQLEAVAEGESNA